MASCRRCWPLAAKERLQRALLADLTGLVPNGKLVLTEESGHYIQLERPDLATNEIGEVIEAVRDSTTGETSIASTPTTGGPPAAQ